MTPEQLIEKMLATGGAIVGSDSCDAMDITIARACKMFATTKDGFGLVLKPKGWVEAAKEGLLMRMYDYAMTRTRPKKEKAP